MLLVDRVLELDGDQKAIGIKNVSINEPFFQGHYPNVPIMPGVLIVEAMAQLGGLLVSNTVDNTGKTPVLLSLDGVKIRKPVTPGDQLVLEAETIQVRARIISVRCRATVAGTRSRRKREFASCSSRRTASIDAEYAMTIHPTAEVDATAHIADGCEIGPFAVVGPRSHLGSDCVLRAHAVVGPDTMLGHRCTVHPLPWSVAIPKTSMER